MRSLRLRYVACVKYALPVFLLLATLVGNFLLTWMVSKASHIDAAAAFIGLMFWGWVWGVWGLLLGMPLLAIMKVIFDHLDALKPLGKLLEGEKPSRMR